MTNVASAATKTAADPSVGGLFGKASSQNGESGQFAQVLTDADSGAETTSSETDGELGKGPASQPNDTLATSRFNSLKELTSLAATLDAGNNASFNSDAATAAPPAAEQSQPGLTAEGSLESLIVFPGSQKGNTDLPAPAGAQNPASPSGQGIVQSGQAQAQVSNLTALLQAGGEQVALDGGEEQVLQQVSGKPVAQSAENQTPTSDLLAKSEDVASDLNLTQLAPVLMGGKRTVAGEGKAEAHASTTDDETAAETPAEPVSAAAPPSASLMAIALSTEALLQLTANPSAGAADELAAMVSAVTIEPPAIENDLEASLPADDGEGSMDFLSSLDDTADAAEPSSFRFQKAGDAAVAISLSITKSEDGSAELQDSLPGTGKAETVTVIDSRRFLGFGMGSNASAVLSAASNDPDWAAAMHPASALSNAASASSTGNVVNTLKLQLNPDNLGPVTANMRLVGDELSIHLTVHSSMAYRELSDDVKPMLESLRAQGFNVDQVTIGLAPASDAAKASGDQQQSNGNAQTQQQLARDGEAARQQSQGQGRSSNQSDRSDVEKRNEAAVEAGIGRSTGAGDVYL